MYSLLSSTAHANCSGVDHYVKGNDGWFFNREKVRGADPESFHVLPGPDSNPFCGDVDSGYAADKLHVYIGSKTLTGADSVTFFIIGSGYSHDATHVYYLENILDGADARHFKKIAPGFFKDSSHVYLNGNLIKNADPSTFLTFGNNSYPGLDLERDAAHLFFGGSVVPTVNPKNVKLLGRQYWTNNQKIYFADKPLALVDSATFNIANDNEIAFSAEDKDHYFLGSQIFNKSECRKVGGIVLACKNYIFASGRKYSQVDVSTLHYLGMFPHMCMVIENSMIYQDKHSMYEFLGDGTIMRFLGFQPDRKYESLDKPLENLLCGSPVTQSLNTDL